jgi:hypothetical protein
LMSGACSYSNVLGRRFETGLGNINGPSLGERRLDRHGISENARRAKFGLGRLRALATSGLGKFELGQIRAWG